MSGETVQNYILKVRQPGWRPSKKDMELIVSCWEEFHEEEKEELLKKLSKLDLPAALKGARLFEALSDRVRGDLARPLLKSLLSTKNKEERSAIWSYVQSWLKDSYARVRKSVAQAVGSHWEFFTIDERKILVEQFQKCLSSASDSSEIKAITVCLSKSGLSEVKNILESVAHGVSQDVLTVSKLTLARDLSRNEDDVGIIDLESWDKKGVVCFFTQGLDQIARMYDPYRGCESVGPGVLRLPSKCWRDLKDDVLWKKAGFELGRVDSDDTEALARLLTEFEDDLCRLVGPHSQKVRIRFGRGSGSSRAQIWDFAAHLEKQAKHLINDGRQAHFDLQVVHQIAVLIPMGHIDQRFSWRDETVDGASDPTLASALVRLANLKEGQKVLDPFCGAATELVLSGKLQKNLQRIGCDINQVVIQKAKHLAQNLGEPIEFINGDFLHQDFSNIDVIITNPPFGMRTLRGGAREVLEQFFQKSKSILRPGGKIVLLSPAPGSTIQWGKDAGLKLEKTFPIKLGRMGCDIQVWLKESCHPVGA